VLVQLNGPQGLLITLMGMVWLSALIWWIARRQTTFLRMLGWALLIASLLLLIRAQPPVQAPVMPASDTGIARVAYSPETLAELRADGTAVFVDATAAWCITCKVNERVALRDPAIEELFRTQKITLMVADWTARDATIRAYLAQYGRDGVPLYVYYAPQKEGIVLPQILTPRIVRQAIETANAS
jgi:thiol:disulfide interchange protein